MVDREKWFGKTLRKALVMFMPSAFLRRNPGSTMNEFRYAGEQFDPNIAFYYLRARWMDPSAGRFMSADPLEGYQYLPFSYHKYLYANICPISFYDPSGEFAWSLSQLNMALLISTIMLSVHQVAWQTSPAYRLLWEAIATSITYPIISILQMSIHGAQNIIYSAQKNGTLSAHINYHF